MSNNGMKLEDKSSLSVSKATRERFTRYLTNLIGKRGEFLTQDDVVNELLDIAEAHDTVINELSDIGERTDE
ncbi:MAG: hypothetical protein ACXV5H_04405 [Halobacteriota archaeon]